MAKTKEKKFDHKEYAEEVEQARAEAAEAQGEPVSPDIFESEWNLMLTRQSQDDAKWLFAVVAEHGGPNIVDDPEPEEEVAIDETYADAAADTGEAKQKK